MTRIGILNLAGKTATLDVSDDGQVVWTSAEESLRERLQTNFRELPAQRSPADGFPSLALLWRAGKELGASVTEQFEPPAGWVY